MMLTKTNFIQYLKCPKSIWLLKNKPETYERGEISLFLEKLIKEGYEAEEYANGLDIPANASPEYIKAILESGDINCFQPAFIMEKGVFARVDILEILVEGTWHIY